MTYFTMSHFLNGLLAVYTYVCIKDDTRQRRYSVCCIKERPVKQTVRKEPFFMTGLVQLFVNVTRKSYNTKQLYIHIIK